jgi:hypothetical protein
VSDSWSYEAEDVYPESESSPGPISRPNLILDDSEIDDNEPSTLGVSNIALLNNSMATLTSPPNKILPELESPYADANSNLGKSGFTDDPKQNTVTTNANNITECEDPMEDPESLV